MLLLKMLSSQLLIIDNSAAGSICNTLALKNSQIMMSPWKCKKYCIRHKTKHNTNKRLLELIAALE